MGTRSGIDSTRPGRNGISPPAATTSIEKALEVCELLSSRPEGLHLTELARLSRQPRPSVHRILRLLKRRGYVRQDETTQRYALTLKMLDLSFRLLGRSELRLHAYPVLRDHVVRSAGRAFIAIPSAGEVTYVWSAGGDEVSMWTAYGKEMPAHCSIYFEEGQSTRRLSCLRLLKREDFALGEAAVRRLEPVPGPAGAQRLCCTCAPVHDYTGREVARVGIFHHGPDEGPLARRGGEAWDLARRISSRLGHVSGEPFGLTA